MEHLANGAGIACPMQVDMAVPDRVIMGGTMQAYPAGIHRIGTREQITAMGPRDYPWLPFCVAAFHPAMIQEVGLPDANLRMWFSDSDYAIRARQAGWRVMLDPRAVVRHEHSAAVTEHRGPDLDRVFVMDQSAFQRKWGGATLEEYS
jgi:GT2 family glycosyltransferase